MRSSEQNNMAPTDIRILVAAKEGGMQCPRCRYENDATAKFCEECGSKLVYVCPSCGHEVRPVAKFCPECGAPLARQSAVQSLEPRVQKSSASGVRRPESKPIAYTPPHLAERIRAEQAALEARGMTEGERKTITALFADIKG